MKSIKAKIMTVILCIVIFSCSILGVVACYLNFITAEDVLKQSLSQTASVTANQVAAEIKAIQNVAVETGSLKEIADPSISIDEKKKIIDSKSANHKFQRGNLLNLKGISLFDGNDYSGRDYFQASIRGETYISDPTISKITGKVTFLISAPIWENGVPGTTIVGVVYFVPDENFLNNIVQSVTIGKTGYAYIINKEGTNVADTDASLVGVENSIQDSQNNSKLKALADIETKMIGGESGFGKYRYNDIDWVQGYAPIKNTNHWSLGVAAAETDFLGNFYISVVTTIVVALLFIVVGIFVAITFSNKIGKPMKECSARMKKLSEGDLQTDVVTMNTKDETAELMQSMEIVVFRMREVVRDIRDVLENIAQGNLTVESNVEYTGDFIPVKTAIQTILQSLNSAMAQIRDCAEQVDSGASQVAGGAQELSSGATEQASSIEELSASMNEIAGQVKDNAQNAGTASQECSKAVDILEESNRLMANLTNAISEIQGKSNQIGKIIKTIDDIAFQTNILALNAAVEAARAGSAGKGFAVVADEVRNLAGKSAEAAKTTTQLIGETVNAVNSGTQMADDTAASLHIAVGGAKNTVNLVEKISIACSDQATAITQVTLGLDQISAVVQTNSATAEESAAASEELSSQSQMLRALVKQFQMKQE